jgi:outer membrane protein assembly factor BamD
MKSKSFVIILLIIVLFAMSCGGAKDKVSNAATAQPGRDKELYDQAMQKLRKGKYDEARLTFNVVITSYSDSSYLALSKLAIADSFYREGGSTQLEQAIGGYKDFIYFFQNHPLACEVRLKIAEAYMQQIIAYNRDRTKAQQAERQLLSCLDACQNSPLKPQIDARLAQVQQVLGLHDLDIARTYTTRQSWKAVESRARDIVEKYPKFTYRDEALYRLAIALIEQEQPEEAAQYFTLLVRDIPNSEYAKDAKKFLEKLGKTIPDPSNDDPAPPRPGIMTRVALITGHNGLTISRDGVLIKEEGEVNRAAEQSLQNPGDATGNAVRSSSVRTVVNPATTSTPAASSNPPKASPDPTDTPKVDPKKKDDKNDQKKEKKKGLFGRIFR